MLLHRGAIVAVVNGCGSDATSIFLELLFTKVTVPPFAIVTELGEKPELVY